MTSWSAFFSKACSQHRSKVSGQSTQLLKSWSSPGKVFPGEMQTAASCPVESPEEEKTWPEGGEEHIGGSWGGFEDRLTSGPALGQPWEMLFTALGGTGVQWTGWGGCSVPNSHLSPFSLGHSPFTKLANKAKSNQFPVSVLGLGWTALWKSRAREVGSFAVFSIARVCEQEYRSTNNTKKQRTTFNCLHSDAPGEQSKALNGEHSLPPVGLSSSFLALNKISGVYLQNKQWEPV